MFTETQPKEVVLRDVRHAPASSEKVAGIGCVAAAAVRQVESSGLKKGRRGGGALPPIHAKAASTSETAAAPHLRKQRPLSGRQEPQQGPESDGQAFPVAVLAIGDLPGRRPSAAFSVTATSRRDDEPRSSRSPAPRRPPSTGRSPARHRSMQASPPRQARQHSASVSDANAISARAGSIGRMEGRHLSGQAPRRTGLKSLKLRVESEEAAVGQLMQAGNIGGALMRLSCTLQSVQDYHAASNTRSSRRGAVGSTASAHTSEAAPQLGGTGAAWAATTAQRLAEVYTTIANNAGVQCNTAAEPIHVQEAYFQAAMRYVVKSSTEDLFSEWTAEGAAATSEKPLPHPPPQQRPRRYPVRSAARPPARELSSCFPSSRPGKSKDGDQQQPQQPAIVRRLLRCAVRTNAAVCLGDSATPGGQARIIYELLKALAESVGVWSMALLYNLAVAFLRVGSYDEAAEAIARFMEVSWHYLEWAEHLQGTDDGGSVASVAAAVHTHAALQLIHGHHFIAAMAAWCEPHGPMEVYHCELASACAEHYLSRSDRAQWRCQRRLAAAQARATTGVGTTETHTMTAADGLPSPLMLPYVTQDLILSCPSSTTAAVTGDVGPITVTMHLLVEALVTSSSLSASLPAEVRAYVREVQKGGSMRYWARMALRAGASPPFLSAAVAASTATPVPPVLTALLSHGEEGECVWARQSWLQSLARRGVENDASNPLWRLTSAAITALASRASAVASSSCRDVAPGKEADASTSLITTAPPTPHHEHGVSLGATSPCKLSKPAPLFVTTLPKSAYNRYRKLREGIVAQLENAEQTEQREAGVFEAAGPLSVDGDDESAVRAESANSRSTAASKILPADAAAAQSRRLLMTALFVGASSTVTSPAASLSREGQGGDATGAFGLLEEEATEHHDARGVVTAIVLDPTLLAVPVRPSELLRQLDLETEARYSRLVADPLADLQRVASTRVQAWWRMQLAREALRRRAADVEMCLRRDAAAALIQTGYRHWKERTPAKAELHRLRAHRERVRCVTILQAFVQQRASVEVWGRVCLVWYQALVVQREIERRRAAATITLQSWWQMHMARRQLRHSVAAAIRLQCLWRCKLARRELRTRRVHRRLMQEQWRRERVPQIIFVQRWWRACCARWAVGDLLCQRQHAVEEYLTAQESEYEAVMRTKLRSVDNVEAAMRCVLAVLAGSRDRRQLAQFAMHARVRQRAVHRFVLLWRGREELQQLRRDRAAGLALQRRREEVAVATVALQSWVRSWLPHRRATRVRANRAYLQAHAFTIWDAFRHYRARQALVNGRTERRMLGVARRLADARNDAATRIQSTWRMHRTQQELFDLFQFMLRDRHKYATAVQCRWRGHYARAVLAPQRKARATEREACLQHRAVLHCAATRVQSLYRMYRVRIQLLRLGVLLRPTSMHRIAAARRIQTCWRACAAHRRVLRLRLQRSYSLKLAQSQEALHAYATLIQGVVRSYLVRCGRVPQPKPAPEALAPVATVTKLLIPPPPSIHGACAAAASRPTPLHRVPSTEHNIETAPVSPLLTRAPVTVEQTVATFIYSSNGASAVVRIHQCDFDGRSSVHSLVSADPLSLRTTSMTKSRCNSASLSRLTSTPDKPLNLLQSVSTDVVGSLRSTRLPPSCPHERAAVDSHQVVGLSCETEHLPASTKDSVAQTSAYLADAKAYPQTTTGLSSAQSSIVCSLLCHHTLHEVEAAVRIQALWRGYHVRCTIEFYYEEYSEEIEEEETKEDN
ncbi:IQ calmodulin-binding motif containing protein [Leishmania donovani]|uniref:IQ_calmodulin-binding_motif_containing_protein_pu tative/Pfam:PF00612 n=1 Tax=Leishmania donovani TaxID=5661 RepID=A0A6J8FI75_LEIDO|nr:IQ calmodulin-binding motif containing protein [Leishmania donovani]VDZ46279.1 IQ_calmodulin-binding_motif_containing_protein_putative/Pfam:PF00612 [Leishmania donovani]